MGEDIKEKREVSENVLVSPEDYDFENKKDIELFLTKQKLKNEKNNSEVIMKALCRIAEIDVEGKNIYMMAHDLIEWIEDHKK